MYKTKAFVHIFDNTSKNIACHDGAAVSYMTWSKLFALDSI